MTAQLASAQQLAIDRIEAISREHSISCDFERVNGYMFQGLPSSDPSYDPKVLDEIYSAANDTGKLDISFVSDAQIPGFDSGKAIQFRQQGSFHPTKYVKALAVVVERMGGKIYEKSRYMMHEEGKGQGGRQVQVEMADGQKVQADYMVMATNVPLQKVCLLLLSSSCGTCTYNAQGGLRQALMNSLWSLTASSHTAPTPSPCTSPLTKSLPPRPTATPSGGTLRIRTTTSVLPLPRRKGTRCSLLVVRTKRSASTTMRRSGTRGSKSGPGSGGAGQRRWCISGPGRSSTLLMGTSSSSPWSMEESSKLIDRMAHIGLNPGTKNVYIHSTSWPYFAS